MGKKCKCCRGPRGFRGPTGPSGSIIPGPGVINIEKTVQFNCDAWSSEPPPSVLLSYRVAGLKNASLFLIGTIASGGGNNPGKIVGEISDMTLPKPFPSTQFYSIRVLNGIQGTDDTLGLLTLESISNGTRITIERIPSSSADFTNSSALIGFYSTTITYTIQ